MHASSNAYQKLAQDLSTKRAQRLYEGVCTLLKMTKAYAARHLAVWCELTETQAKYCLPKSFATLVLKRAVKHIWDWLQIPRKPSNICRFYFIRSQTVFLKLVHELFALRFKLALLATRTNALDVSYALLRSIQTSTNHYPKHVETSCGSFSNIVSKWLTWYLQVFLLFVMINIVIMSY